MKRWFGLLAVLFFTLALAGCGGGGGGSSDSPSSPVTPVTPVTPGVVTGAVYKASPTGGITPVGGATVYVDGAAAGSTASDGSFAVTGTNSAAVITVESAGYTQESEAGIDFTKGDNLSYLIQPLDPKDSYLTVPSPIAKPTPKKISNEKGDVTIDIEDMVLAKDTKVKITELEKAINAPAPKKITGPVGYSSTIVGGAKVKLNNGKDGNDTDNETAGFSGKVTPATSKILGSYTAVQLEHFLGKDLDANYAPGEKDQLAQLYQLKLYAFDKGEWEVVGAATIEKTDIYSLKPIATVNMSKLKSFAFVLLTPESLNGKVTGKVTDQSTGNAIPNAVVTVGEKIVKTDGNGNFSAAMKVPYKSPLVSYQCSKPDYYGASGSVSMVYNSAADEIVSDVQISLVPVPKVTTIQGQALNDSTNAGIAAATVTLKTDTYLDTVSIVGTTLTVAPGASAYQWSFKLGGSWVSFIGATSNSIDLQAYAAPIIAIADSTFNGKVAIKVEVTHTNGLKEELVGSTFIDLQLPATATISGDTGIANLWGGADTGFYFVSAPVGDAGTVPSIEWYVKAKEATVPNIFTESSIGKGNILTYGQVQAALAKNILNLKNTPEALNGFTVEVGANINYTLAGSPQSAQVFGEFDVSAVSLNVADIQWSGISLQTEYTTATDATGAYIFKNIEPELSGSLAVKGVAAGYKASAQLNVGTFVAGQTVTKNIPMTALQAVSADSFAWNFDGGCSNWTVENLDAASVQWQCLDTPQNYKVPTTLVDIIQFPEEGVNDAGVPVNNSGTSVGLLSAFAGTGNAWFGSMATKTISDIESNSSTSAFNGKLISPEIDLGNHSAATLNFWTWFEVESVDIADGQFDQMHVKVQYLGTEIYTLDDGTIISPNYWYTVKTMNPTAEPTTQDGIIGYSSGGLGAEPVWTNAAVNLNAFVGKKIQIAFEFDTNDSAYNGFRGWAVDSVNIVNQDSGLPVTISSNYYKPTKRQ